MTSNPELRSTTSGISVCTFTVAVNRRVKQGEERKADFFRVSAWRERGETCAKYLSKGKKVCVRGMVTLSTWEKDNRHGANLEVTADEVEFLTPRNAGEQAQSNQPEPQIDQQSGMQVVDEELPF